MSPRGTSSRPRVERLGQPTHLRLSGLLAIYWIRLRLRWPQELLAVIGIAVGVALLFSSQVASTSLSGPVKQLAHGLVGDSQLQVVGRGSAGLPADVAKTIARVPGVRVAAPILQAQANAVGPRGSSGLTLFGSDPRIVKLRGSLLTGFSGDDVAHQRTVLLPMKVAQEIGVAFGDDVRLEVDGRTVRVSVATVSREQIGGLADTSIGLAPISYLQDLARQPGRASRVLVQADPDMVPEVREELQRLAGDRFDVRPADYEAQLFDVAAAPTSQATTIASVLSAMIGFLFAICAMLVTAASRRALAIDLRMDGFRPRQVIGILLVEALLLGAVAVLVGLAVGDLISRRGSGADVDFLGGAFPVGHLRVVTWTSYAIAIAGGMLAALIGVLAPVRRIVFASIPQRFVGDSHAAPTRSLHLAPVAGGLLLVAAIAITVLAPSTALVGLLALAASLVLLLPTMLDGTIAVLGWLNHRGEMAIMPVELALHELRAPEWRPRALAIAMTGAIAVFGAVSLQGARANLQAGLDRVSGELDSITDVWVAPHGPGTIFATTPFTATETERLRRIPGVRSVELYRAGLLDISDRRAWVIAPPATVREPIPPTQILEGDYARASARIRSGGWVTLSRALANDLDVQLGEQFVLPAPNPTRVRVAAITTNLGWSGDAIVTNADEFARAWGSTAIGAYLLRFDRGIAPAEGRYSAALALGARTALRAETVPQRHDRQKAAARSGLTRLSQIASLALVAAMFAMAAAMTGLLWQRRPDVARQKLDGHRTGLMWRALAVESGSLFGTGCLIGALFGLGGQVLFSRGLTWIAGFPVDSSIRLGVAATSFGLVTLVAMLAVAIPGFLVARVRPALRDGD